MKRTFKHWWQARIAPLEHRLAARRTHKYRAIARLLETYLPVGGVALDIGANHGKFAKELALLRAGNCTVHCFEPLPYNLPILTATLRELDNVTIEPVALSDRSGSAELTVPYKPNGRIGAGSAGLGPPAGPEYAGLDTEQARVPTVTLDQWVGERGVARIDLIKIDAEGAEFMVFAGGAQTLQCDRPAIYAELGRVQSANFGRRPEQTVEQLAAFGYRLYRADADAGTVKPIDRVDDALRDYLLLADVNPAKQ